MVGKFPAGIDPALIHLTGTIVTWWGRIEGCLVHDLITLRQFPINAEYIAKQPFPVSTGRIIKQWSRLQRALSHDDPNRLEKVTKIAERHYILADERNVIVHYFWPYGSINPQKIKLQAIKPRRGDNAELEFLSCEVDIESLDELNHKLRSLYHTVMVESLNLVLSRSQLDRTTGDTISLSAKGNLDCLPPNSE